MSQDLYGFLKERAAIRVLRFPAGLALSAGAHVLVAGIILLAPRMAPAPETPKITWVTLPAAGDPAFYVDLDYRVTADTADYLSVLLVSQRAMN